MLSIITYMYSTYDHYSIKKTYIFFIYTGKAHDARDAHF